MALSLTLSIGAPCAGDGHFSVTADLTPGGQVTMPVHKAALLEAPTIAEVEAFVRVLLRLYVRQMAGTSAAQIKAALEAKTLDLTVTG